MSAADAAGATARLFRGEALALSDDAERRLVEFLVERRLAPEVAALPGATALSRSSRRRLGIERERAGALAVARTATRERCARALASAGVPALLLKGEAVVALCHGDASRRPMADLDLLVASGDRPRAGAALLAAGLRAAGADTILHDVFLDPAGAGPATPRGVAVEVHDDIFPRPHPFGLDLDGALRRAGGGSPGLHAPLPEDALLLTAFSFVFHETDGRKSWMILRDLALLAGVVECNGDAARLAAVGGSGGVAAAVAGALRLAERHAGAPALVARGLASAAPETLRRSWAIALALREIESTLVGEPPADRSLTRRLASALWQPTVAGTVRALVARLAAPGGGGPRGRMLRQLRALARLGRT